MARLSPAFLSFWLAFLVASLLYLPGLGHPALLDYDESGYAGVAIDTFQSSDPLTLNIGGMKWFEKPPLYFWVSGATNALIPDVELASRLPSAFAAMACVALVWLILYALTESACLAFFGATLLSTTASFIDIARQGRVDTLIMAMSLLAVYAFIRAARNPRWYLLLGLALGLGVMTKSVVALFVLPMLALWFLFERRWRELRIPYLWLGAGVALLTVLPWHLYETVKYGSTFWQRYLLHHVLDRYDSNILAGQGTNTDYLFYLRYYAPLLSSIFLASLLGFACRWRRMDMERRHAAAALSFGALSILAIFFSARTKVVYYLPFAYPFMAIVSTLALREWKGRTARVLASVLLLISAAVGLHTYIYADPNLAYERAVAQDERAIGAVLQSRPGTVYFTAPAYWETVRFYGGDTRDLERWSPQAARPAYVVVHRGYGDPLATTTKETLYEGTEVSLYRVP